MTTTPSPDPTNSQPAERRLKARFLTREIMGVVLMAVFLFLTAGTVSWPAAWVLLGIMTLWVAGTAYVLFRWLPDLIAERLGPRKGGKSWDIVILSIVGIGNLIRLVVAGLDFRYGWSDVPLWLQITAAVVVAAAYALIIWATYSNKYFSQVVRIQDERDHTVATGGPYHYIRHPAYVGSVLSELFVPLLLGSWWALIPGVIDAVLMIVRTAMEDRTLQQELNGYTIYANEVRYRLIPGVW
jgi:protein-S-isoprenylcysteine O-methyltransferase Ste14